jgi:hypothetical protein
MKPTVKCPSGTSFYNHTVQATLNQLEAILGEPSESSNDGSDKTNVEWVMETETGDVFTVYDWKEYRVLWPNEVITWHIGAVTPRGAMIAQEELKNALPAPEMDV